ncbi:STAS domain-containing protein [Paenibacillus cymbidii]|uniref:STAS domain-containing protein n=1 Tax=Paenibacillus cymbidii TaxID=1639034 RepID=UPI0010813E51|nr:STAS domain-containing protein [Paenibacillus cymbidii]
MTERLIIDERTFAWGYILDLQGELTKLSEEKLLGWRPWAQGLDGKPYLVLNLTGIRLINSAGIALLIRLSQHALKAGFSIYAFGVNAHYQKMFRLIGLTEFILLYPDEYSLVLRLEEH